MQVAESKGLPKLKYHLLPRTKGFWVTVQNLRGTGELIKCSNMATSLHELDVCLRRRREASAYQTSPTVAVNRRRSLCPVQPQLSMIPRWTSETTKHRPCLTFWTGRNITRTCMWGTQRCFAARIASFNFLLTGVMVVYQAERSDFPPLARRRIPLESIPEDEAECAAWLHKLYQEKVSVLRVEVSDGYRVSQRGSWGSNQPHICLQPAGV